MPNPHSPPTYIFLQTKKHKYPWFSPSIPLLFGHYSSADEARLKKSHVDSPLAMLLLKTKMSQISDNNFGFIPLFVNIVVVGNWGGKWKMVIFFWFLPYYIFLNNPPIAEKVSRREWHNPPTAAAEKVTQMSVKKNSPINRGKTWTIVDSFINISSKMDICIRYTRFHAKPKIHYCFL